MRPLPAAALALVLCACGGGETGSRRPPSPTAPPPEPLRWTVAGSIVDTISRNPVPEVTLTFSGHSPITATHEGIWELSGGLPIVSRTAVTLEAGGYVRRETAVTWTSAGRQGVELDLIADKAPFALGSYRELVRNGFEEPEELEAIRRWTRSPDFYVHAVNPKTGQPLLAREIESIEHVIRESVPQLTGGRFGAGAIEIGSSARDPRVGVINVKFVYEPEGDNCGEAFVGANPGEITINYERCPDACGAFAPEILAHEVGHAMGFWHTRSMGGIMNTSRVRRCANVQFSDAERLHARVAYSRPNGNTDPDVDPPSFVSIESGDAPLIVCRR